MTPTISSRIGEAYKTIFSLHEISNDLAVRLFGGAVLLGFLASFRGWEGNSLTALPAAANGAVLCWPFLQNCYDWVFMTIRPYGYMQNTIFMIMLGVIFTGAYGLIAKRYTLAHVCVFILFLWKMYIVSISYHYNGKL